MRDREERPGFEEFVAARRAALHRTAYLLTGDHHAAEDLVQVALMKAVPHWDRIADHPEPYVRRILVRENVSRWRRRRWREEAAAAPPDRPSADEDRDSSLVLRAAIAALPPRQRAVVVLRFFDDRTEAETARLLGVTVGTVKSQGHAALARLRERIPDLRVEDPAREGAMLEW